MAWDSIHRTVDGCHLAQLNTLIGRLEGEQADMLRVSRFASRYSPARNVFSLEGSLADGTACCDADRSRKLFKMMRLLNLCATIHVQERRQVLPMLAHWSGRLCLSQYQQKCLLQRAEGRGRRVEGGERRAEGGETHIPVTPRSDLLENHSSDQNSAQA